MNSYQLFCRGESGNAYKVALMLNLLEVRWTPRFVDFFDDASKATFQESLNEMGELPVLQLDDGRTLSQSGAILQYLARTHGRFLPVEEGQADEVLRWLLFDNHRFTAPFATLRYLVGLRGGQESPLTTHLRALADTAYRVVDAHLASRNFMVGSAPTIADISMVGYLYYDEETRFGRTRFTNIQSWAARIAELPGWAHPYDLMPRAMAAEPTALTVNKVLDNP